MEENMKNDPMKFIFGTSLCPWVGMPSHLGDVFSCYFVNKTEL